MLPCSWFENTEKKKKKEETFHFRNNVLL